MAVQTSPAYSCCNHCLVMSSGTETDRMVRSSPRNPVLDIQLSYAASLILVRKYSLICSQQFILVSQLTATFAHLSHSLWKRGVNSSVSVGPAGLRQVTVDQAPSSVLRKRQSNTEWRPYNPLSIAIFFSSVFLRLH